MIRKTLGFYLAWSFLRNAAGIFLLFFFLIIAVDAIEFSRRVGAISNVTFNEVAQVVLFRTPLHAENVLPFAVMFGASATLILLNRRHELVVARASGVSVWQFLLPLAITAALIGLFSSLLYNPLALAGKTVSNSMESDIFSRRKGASSPGSRSIWMRLNQTGGDVIIRAQIQQDKGAKLTNVTAYRYTTDGEMTERIDAATAEFVETGSRVNHYVLTDLVSSVSGNQDVRKNTAILPVNISKSQLQANQTTADSVSFWDLKLQAARASEAGKNVLPFLTRFQSLLSAPLLFIAMVLLAATASLRFARFGINPKAILAGVLAGFVLYVFSKLLVTFGSNGLVPPFFAAWSPALVASLIGMTVLLHQEDG